MRDQIMARIGFHGIVLVLRHAPETLAAWPAGLQAALREQARSQTFWEMSHREVIARLVEMFGEAGATGVFIKGTALAYSVYPEPAMRRRGDSDILLDRAARKPLIQSLQAAGFEQVGDMRSLQESWATQCRLGFVHEFDLHWRINASPVISDALERGGVGTRSLPLARLAEGARGLSHADNIVVIAINRANHGTFGYHLDGDNLYEEDRLIWALDIDLACRAMGDAEWAQLVETAAASGTAPVVLSALNSAEALLGTAVPPSVTQALAADPGEETVLRYIGELPGLERLLLNLAASRGLRDKLAMIRYTVFPRTESMRRRFPDTPHWPTVALYARRMISGLRPLWRRGE
ncbi:MAG: nucleotidyltransferase family protein [Erythrobacter sp.]